LWRCRALRALDLHSSFGRGERKRSPLLSLVVEVPGSVASLARTSSRFPTISMSGSPVSSAVRCRMIASSASGAMVSSSRSSSFS
jgi:hypothetical protein